MFANSAVHSVTLDRAIEDFHLARRAKGHSPETLDRYMYSAGMFVPHLNAESVERPGEVTSRWVNPFLDEVSQKRLADGLRPLADAMVHAVARGTGSLMKIWYSDGYLTSPIAVPMPQEDQKCPRFLAQDQVRQILGRWRSRPDQALLLLLSASEGRRKRTARPSSIKIIPPTSSPSTVPLDVVDDLVAIMVEIARGYLSRIAPGSGPTQSRPNST
jgi:hypothetical protein